MWGISRGFILIQDGGDRSCKDFWVHFGTLERTQVFTGICHFIVIQISTSMRANALILRLRLCCSVKTTLLNVADVHCTVSEISTRPLTQASVKSVGRVQILDHSPIWQVQFLSPRIYWNFGKKIPKHKLTIIFYFAKFCIPKGK